MTSHRRRRGRQLSCSRSSWVFIDKVELFEQVSVQNEARLKPHWTTPDAAGQAPPLLEPARRPPMRGRGMAHREIEEILPGQEGAADAPSDTPRPPPLQEEAADTPEDCSEPAPPPVELADTPIAPDEMEIFQIHEKEAAEREPPVLATPPVVVQSPVVAATPVQLEHRQRTRAPLSYLKDFLCDAVQKPVSAIIKEIWGDKQLEVAVPQYRETQL